MSEQVRYRFGPLERRGLLFGLRAAQGGIILLGIVVSLIVVKTLGAAGILPGGLVFVLSVAAVFFPIAGRTPEMWAPVAVRFVWNTLLRRKRFTTTAPLVGRTRIVDASTDLPPSLKGMRILAAPVVGGELGVLHNRMDLTYSSVLSVRGRSFALLDQDAKARLLGQWADVLAGLGREGSPIKRLQWLERTVPDPGDGIGQYLRDAIALPHTTPAVRSYLQLVEDAGPATQHHETFIVIQVDAQKAKRMIKQAGGGDQGACTVLARETFGLATRLQGAELDVVGMLPPRLVAQMIRVAFDPKARSQIAMRTIAEREAAGVAVDQAWPLVTETAWDHYRTDSAYHSTFWVAEWPRTDVGPDFLAPLLMQAWVNRTVSVTLEAVPPMRAQRDVEYARTSDVADAHIREKHGFLRSIRRQRESENVVRREQELADGHADVRFSGYVTVSAETLEELEMASSEIEQQAGQSRLVLRRLSGEQDVAFTYTLPLGRGLR
jgi:hypothetical protein